MEIPERQSDETDALTSRIPDTCHRICNHAAVEAGPKPKDWTICVLGSTLQVNAANCLDCMVHAIAANESLTYEQSDAEILSTLRAWRNFCDGWDDGSLSKAVDDMSTIIGEGDSVIVLPKCPAVPRVQKLPFSVSCMGTATSSSFVSPTATASHAAGTGQDLTATATATTAATAPALASGSETALETSSETATGAASLRAVSFAPTQFLLLLWVLLSAW